MKTVLRFVFALAFVLFIAACASPSPIATPTRSSIELVTDATPTSPPSAPTQFDAQRAYAHVQMLAVTIGKRVAGSPDGYKAGDYIAAQFASYGLQVEKQEFPFQAWEDLETTVQMLGANGTRLNAQPIQYSPPGRVEAEVVAVPGVGNPGDFQNVDVKGKIALVARGTLQFFDKATNAANAGAAAILIYNTQAELFTGTMRDLAPISTLALSGSDGQNLLNALKQDAVRVSIVSQTQVSQKTGRNIIGTRAGDANNVLVLGGHYDSVAAGPGANDNGSGTGVLLELARVLATSKPPSSGGKRTESLVFVAFDGEEFGLLGSSYYVQHLSNDERAKIRAMLNFDMLAGGSGPLLLGGNGALSALARKASVELNIDNQKLQLAGGASSDFAPFQQAGIDTVFFSRDYQLLHTPQDTLDQVRVDWLDEAGRVAERTIEELAGSQ